MNTELESLLNDIIPIPLNENVSNENLIEIDNEVDISDEIDIDKLNVNLSEYVYKDVLAPELKENENLKREHKKELINLTKKIIYINFFIIIIFIIFVFSGILFFDKITFEFCQELLSFLKYFLTAIFVEFISILFFIVQSVFDKSISDMFKSFKNKN